MLEMTISRDDARAILWLLDGVRFSGLKRNLADDVRGMLRRFADLDFSGDSGNGGDGRESAE